MLVVCSPSGARMRRIGSPTALNSQILPSPTCRPPTGSSRRPSPCRPGPLPPVIWMKVPLFATVRPSGKKRTRHTAFCRVTASSTWFSAWFSTRPFGLGILSSSLSSRPSAAPPQPCRRPSAGRSGPGRSSRDRRWRQTTGRSRRRTAPARPRQIGLHASAPSPGQPSRSRCCGRPWIRPSLWNFRPFGSPSMRHGVELPSGRDPEHPAEGISMSTGCRRGRRTAPPGSNAASPPDAGSAPRSRQRDRRPSVRQALEQLRCHFRQRGVHRRHSRFAVMAGRLQAAISPSCFSDFSAARNASAVRSSSRPVCAAETLPPGQPLRSTPLFIMARRSLFVTSFFAALICW